MPGMPVKQYGLILPNKKKGSIRNLETRALNPLLDSDDELERDEDDAEAINWVEESLKKSAGNSGQKSLQKRLLREALAEDATVFQYDEVYDDMKEIQNRQKEKEKQQLQRKPKYIDTILKHSEKRKLENERRQERNVQKERDAEGNEFKDKESFVTPSYLKKLEELRKAEMVERVESILEERDDVMKHKNFGRFYNHLFKQRVGGGNPSEATIKEEPVDDHNQSSTTGGNNTKESIESSGKFKQKLRASKHYRTQDDASEDEDAIRVKPEPEIKTEAQSSSSESEPDERVSERLEYRHRRVQRPSSISPPARNRKGNDNNKRLEEKTNERRTEHRSPLDKRESRRSRSRDKEHRVKHKKSRSRSRGRHDRIDRSLSRDRHRGDSSRHNHREKSRERSDRSRRSRSRNREDYRAKERSDSSRKDHRDKYASKDRRRRSRSKESNHSNKYSERRSKTTKSNNGKDHPVNSKSHDENKENVKDVKQKQSINTTLGSTDVNKMKMQDRIQRFKKLFTKRTVGDRYEEAVHRFFARKAERESIGLLS